MLQRRISQRSSQRGRGGGAAGAASRAARSSHRLSVYELPPVNEKDPLQFKILVVGAPETEKTKLLQKYVQTAGSSGSSTTDAAATADMQLADVYCSWRKRITIEGVDFLLDLRDIPSGDGVSATCVDLDIKEADGVVFMYSVDSPSSLKEAIQMKGYVTRKRLEREKDQVEGNAALPMILVGVDHGVQKREIPWEDDQVKISKSIDELVKEIYRYKFSPAGQPIVTPSMREAKKAAFRYTRADAPDLQFVQGGEEDVQPRIKAASLERLVERLTYEKYPYPTLARTFMLMYRQYTTGQQLMSLLIDRFTLPVPPGNPLSQEEWKQRVQTPIRLRVYNLLKLWISKHFDDFEQDPLLTEMLLRFIEGPVKAYNLTCANQLVSLLTEMKVKKDKKRKSLPVMFGKEAPKPKISRKVSMGTFAFKDLNPVELARQLTLMDFRYFKRLTPLEFILWNKLKKHEKPDRAPNIYNAIHKFNALNRLVKSEVVLGDKPKSRALVIARWIQTAQACLELNNFNAVMMIVSALDDCAVHRLKQTWKLVPRKLLKQFQDFKQLVEARGSFHNLRMAQKAAISPLLPYLGMFLTDLAYVYDGNPDYINNLINVEKMDQMVSVVREIQLSFQTPYCLEEVPHIQSYLQREAPLDEQELYRLSCEKEPSASTTTPASTAPATTSFSAKFNAFFSSASSSASPSAAVSTPSNSLSSAASSPTQVSSSLPTTSPLTSSVSTSAATSADKGPTQVTVTKPWSYTQLAAPKLPPMPVITIPPVGTRPADERRPSFASGAPPQLPTLGARRASGTFPSVNTAAKASNDPSPAAPTPVPPVSTTEQTETAAQHQAPAVPEPAVALASTNTSTSTTTAASTDGAETASSQPAPMAPSPAASSDPISATIDALEKRAGAMENVGILDPATLKSWLDEMEKKDGTNQTVPAGELNTFKKGFLRSRTLEIVLRTFIRQPVQTAAETDASLLQLLSRTMIGGPKLHKDLFAGLRALSPTGAGDSALVPGELIELVAKLVCHCFKTIPLDEKLLDDLQELNKKSADIILLLQKIEDTEGAHSVTLNEEKIEITSVLMELGQVTLKVIDGLNSVDDLGSRCVCLPTEADVQTLDDLSARIEALAAAPVEANVRDLVAKIKTDAKRLRSHDTAAMKSALLMTANDQLDTIELHFQKLLDQMSLLTRRLLKLWDLRQVREKILNTETPGIEPDHRKGTSNEKEEIVQKIEVTWDKDMANMQVLLSAVNVAEQKFYAFATYYQQLLGDEESKEENNASEPGASKPPKKLPPLPGQAPIAEQRKDVSLDNNKELGRVFNYVLRIRKLQKELDDVILPAAAPTGEGTDSDSGDELSLEEVGVMPSAALPASPLLSSSHSSSPPSSPTTLSPVTSSDSITVPEEYRGASARPVPVPPRPGSPSISPIAAARPSPPVPGGGVPRPQRPPSFPPGAVPPVLPSRPPSLPPGSVAPVRPVPAVPSAAPSPPSTKPPSLPRGINRPPPPPPSRPN